MKTKSAMKSITAAALATCMLLTGTVIASAESYAYTTKNGVTEGNYAVETDDMGSAYFNVEGNHVETTNFAFDADPDLYVMAEIADDDVDLIFTDVEVHDGEDLIQRVIDGLYPEVFTQDTIVDQFNTIYQLTLGATDIPISDAEQITYNEGVMYVKISLTDAELFMFAKEDTDQYILIAATTPEYGSDALLNTAFNALEA